MSNDEDFSRLAENLQKKIDYDEEKEYSKMVIKEYRNPSNFGYIKNPDARGTIKGPCGDTMSIDLIIKNNIIAEVSYWTDGCGASIACGSMLTKMVTGKTLQEANKFTNNDLLQALNGLPTEHQHCALLAIKTLHASINKYFQ